MAPPSTARPDGDRPRVALSTATSTLLALFLTLLICTLAVSAAGAAPSPSDSPSTAESSATDGTPADTVDDAENETHKAIDDVTNASGQDTDESNESEGVGPVTPSNWSNEDDARNDSAAENEDEDRAPWTWEWSSNWSGHEDSMADDESNWPDAWLGPQREEGTGTQATAEMADGEDATTTRSAGDATTGAGASSALSTTLPSGGDDDCGGCSVVGGVGVIVAVGVSRRVGTALSLGVPLPHPAAPPSFQTAAHWVDKRMPRLPPILPGQYSRRDDSDPLAHTRRSELAANVADNPGIPLATLADRLDVPRSTVRYHVRVLEEEDELETANVLGRRRVFPAGKNTELVAALADEGTRRIVTTLTRIQPATGSRIADETDKANSTVSYHLERLAAAGVVERDRDGKYVYNRLATDAEDVVTTVDQPSLVEEAPQ